MLITLRGERVKPILFPQYVLSTPKEFLFLSVTAHCFFFLFFFGDIFSFQKSKIKLWALPHTEMLPRKFSCALSLKDSNSTKMDFNMTNNQNIQLTVSCVTSSSFFSSLSSFSSSSSSSLCHWHSSSVGSTSPLTMLRRYRPYKIKKYFIILSLYNTITFSKVLHIGQANL